MFYNPAIREALYPRGVTTALVELLLYPEAVRDIDLQFTAILVLPARAISQGVVLGEPSKTIVTVPATRGM